MVKVFYFLNDVTEWIDIVQLLKINKQWEPTLWVSREKLQPLIKEKFPDTQIIDLFSHRRGEFDYIIYKNNNIVLDNKIIEEYLSIEKNVITMMARMDPTRHNFNYHQRVQLYYRILLYWLYIFDKFKPNIVFFDQTPHNAFEYIMHEVAIKNNIKIIRTHPTHIIPRLALFGKINETPYYIKKLYKELTESSTNFKLSQDIENYYKKLRGDYENAKPLHMKKQPIDIQKIFVKALFIFKRVLSNETTPTYCRTEDGYLHNDILIKFKKLYYQLKARVYKRTLFKRYNELSNKNIDLSCKYIYVPLHYQPERTTSPEGDIYENQWLMIQMLSKTLPKGWKIYVKEHIDLFRIDFIGERGRNIEFYRELLLFDNVNLIPLNLNSFELIDNCKMIATVSGTAGLEGVARGKRVLLFGYPWFEICEGFTKIKNSEDIKYFFNTIFSKKISQNKVKAFFKLIDIISIQGNHNDERWWSRGFDKKKNIENIFKIIDKYENKI